eukprot:CAMPEP_0203753828 /NCGR_PEP_ID=MMETSP0098-20131031/7536_1 /ASSEMBLY_ACC=CAM_ASM_000208 /TAXON_ID=96639 /ORGANISM=" , Strain NY0313808BC1" /LENGTH=57 /DNA_ID=CAMNT_0050644599 /DNA_START=71 /DNA_END=244 /DNA_ORIENTATION=-
MYREGFGGVVGTGLCDTRFLQVNIALQSPMSDSLVTSGIPYPTYILASCDTKKSGML